MEKIYETECQEGFLEVTMTDGCLNMLCGAARGSPDAKIGLNATEHAHLAEALLRALDRSTRIEIIESVLGLGVKNKLVQDAFLGQENHNGRKAEMEEGRQTHNGGVSLP